MTTTPQPPNTGSGSVPPSPLLMRRALMDALLQLEAEVVHSRHLRTTLGNALRDKAPNEAWLPYLIKELTRTELDHNPARLEAVGELLMELGSLEYLANPLFALVTRTDISDEVKELIHLVLHSLGDDSDPEFFYEHLTDPDGLMEREATRTFELAEQNPEALMEFMEAFGEVDDEYRDELIVRLRATIPAKSLVHAALPLLLSLPFGHSLTGWCLDVIGESANPLAAWCLHMRYLMPQSPHALTAHESEISMARYALKKLRISGAYRPELEMTLNQACNTLPIWANTIEKQDALATLPNGNGEQALVLVNYWRSGDIGVMVLLVNDSFGIEDAMVYNYLTQAELKRWLIRFNDGNPHFKVPLSYFREKAETSEALNFQLGAPLPQAFTCWRSLIPMLDAPTVSLEVRCQEWKQARFTGETNQLLEMPDFQDWVLTEDDAPDAVRHFIEASRNNLSLLQPNDAAIHSLLETDIHGLHTLLVDLNYYNDYIKPRLAEASCIFGWNQLLYPAALAALAIDECEKTPTPRSFVHSYLKEALELKDEDSYATYDS
jgi:hypothetical protein